MPEERTSSVVSQPREGGEGIDYGALVLEDRVSGRIYRDEAVFRDEMERIFYRGWVYVAHESEIPRPGDFKTTTMGRQPVIVNRTSDGGINVMMNRCRHRGVTVCDERLGNSRRFECPYHAWVYDEDGRLFGVPFRPGYPEEFDVRRLGLTRAPRVSTYRGLVFASFEPDVEDLESYLGNAKPYLDAFTGRGGEAGIEVTPSFHQTEYPGNWKFQIENSVDYYHVSFVHKIYSKMLAERGSSEMAPPSMAQDNVHKNRDLGNGHVSLYSEPSGDPTTEGPDFLVVVFPNLVIANTQLRVVTPLAADRTLVESIPTMVAGARPEDVMQTLRSHEDFYGPSGFGAPDDMEVFRRASIGLEATYGDDWVYFVRGVGREEVTPSGVIQSDTTDETAQRGFYRRYRELMTR